MIFGGLEIVAGGYLIHRHYRKKGRKEQLEEDAQKRRHHTFPGTTNAKPNGWDTQAHHRPQHHRQPAIAPHKYACYAPAPPQYQPPPPPQSQSQAPCQPRPHPPTHTQSFSIPRRPVPQRKPQIIIQPALQRTDSFATISRMPIANGSRPQDMPEQASPAPPPPGGLSPVPQHGIYGNAGFSVSTPAFGATPTSPGLMYEMATAQTVDDNWETYGHGRGSGGQHYAPTSSTELGERYPPPPYAP